MNQMDRRLSRLERDILEACGVGEAAEAKQAEWDARFAAAAAELSSTMEQEHIRRVNAYLTWDPADGPCPDQAAGHLSGIAERLLRWAADGQTPVQRLALPGAVAEVLMAERAELFHHCPDCRLMLPWARRWWLDNATMIFQTEGLYFPDGCPGCGSRRILEPRMPTSFEPGGINDWAARKGASK